TYKREVTFHDGKDGHPKGVCHIPMYPAYNEKLRQVLITSAEELKYKFFKTGTAICIEGPRYSSRAESELYRSWNADIVNMTVCPEVYLAKELGIPFATTAIVTDYDCWREDEKTILRYQLIWWLKECENLRTELKRSSLQQSKKLEQWTGEMK
ncbi:unnamed protein product, partial [Onchocerca ochengi]